VSTGLDWQMDEDGDEPPEFKGGRWPVTSLAVIVAILVVIALAFGAWGAGRERATKRTETLEEAAQDLLDVLHRAYLDGDGELFFANQLDEPAWLSAQLQPLNQILYLAGPQVTRVEQFADDVWANIQWQQADQTLQRVVFFRWQNGRLIQVPTASGYWGSLEESAEAFGRLQVHQADQDFEEEIARFVVQTISERCGSSADNDCRPGSQPFVLTIAPDFATTAGPDQLRVPSPRLLGLDENGRPSNRFWNQLRRALTAHLTSATIRFAVPQEFLAAYRDAADTFSSQRPDIQVEILTLESLAEDPLSWPADIDGAALAPDERMITAGQVFDLTDFVRSDPAFDEGDYYEQVWQGGWWQERMWFLPNAADMRLLFYDRQAYEQTGLPEPSLRWTWAEMNKDLAALAAAPDSERFSAIFLDPSPDALFSYAFNLDNDCPGEATVTCTEALSNLAVTKALDWFQALTAVDGMTVDLSQLSPEERDHVVINIISPRKVVIWTEQPVLFEHHILFQPTGVVPFPGSERFDGITPLWVRGGFISQSSRHPLATWEWLKFLTYHPLAPQKRMVPARPSVALASHYWSRLPRPVGEAMRTAFPFARPVLIEEYGYFTWDQLATISSGERTAAEVIQSMAHVRWFGSDG